MVWNEDNDVTITFLVEAIYHNIISPSSYLVFRPILDFYLIELNWIWSTALNYTSHIPGNRAYLMETNKGFNLSFDKTCPKGKQHPVPALSHKLFYLSPQDTEGKGFLTFSGIGRMQMALCSWICTTAPARPLLNKFFLLTWWTNRPSEYDTSSRATCPLDHALGVLQWCTSTQIYQECVCVLQGELKTCFLSSACLNHFLSKSHALSFSFSVSHSVLHNLALDISLVSTLNMRKMLRYKTRKKYKLHSNTLQNCLATT